MRRARRPGSSQLRLGLRLAGAGLLVSLFGFKEVRTTAGIVAGATRGQRRHRRGYGQARPVRDTFRCHAGSPPPLRQKTDIRMLDR